MRSNQKIRPARVIGPLGELLSLETLPPLNTARWVVRRKAEVVAAVVGGLLTVDEACERYRGTGCFQEFIVGVHQYNLEAKHCRELAEEFITRPERPVLFRIAETFEELARDTVRQVRCAKQA